MFEGYVIYVNEYDMTKKLYFHDILENETIEEYLIRSGWKFKSIIDLYKQKI